MGRVQRLTRGLDKANMVGIEVGPFYAPLVPKADGWRTTVVDFTDAETLRAIAAAHPHDYIRTHKHVIEDVDIVWKGEPLDTLCLDRRPEGYDFLVASHVIEHIPDLIGFFAQLSRLLKPKCVVSLAVPDMRRCFDVLKSPTNTAHALTAHREKRKMHSPEVLFEAWAFGAWNKGEGSWLAGSEIDLDLTEPLSHAWEKYKAYVEGTARGDQAYVDAHAWYFTPASFELTVLELNALGLIDFAISSLAKTLGSEFIVRMERGRLALPEDVLHRRRRELLLTRQVELMAETGVQAMRPWPGFLQWLLARAILIGRSCLRPRPGQRGRMAFRHRHSIRAAQGASSRRL
jgi:hypothetical protein